MGWHNPLHEWEESSESKRSDSLITWVFDEGTISPSAKLTNQGNYSIITDHLGTPVEAYDSDGKKVWEQELDIYGRVKPRPVKKEWGQVVDDGMFDEHFVPFRYQGQFHDEEIDLYYNRFRYYDSQLGQYITQDPIGLEGENPTFYGYVGDPNTWIDPLGLAQCKVRSRVGENEQLVRAAAKMGKNTTVQKEANNLINQFLQGNANPEIGTKNLKNDISYLRGRHGARIFFQMENGRMVILGKSNKANEQEVMNIILRMYGN